MPARVIIFMGVSASGKTTIGKAFANNNNLLFIDGDDLHPALNIKKMKQGNALTDADREDWFTHIITTANEQLALNKTVVIACSALKKKYRQTLRNSIMPIVFIYLQITYEQALHHATTRKHQFMPVSLLQSQFKILEEPEQDEKDIITIINTKNLQITLDKIQQHFSEL